MDKYHFLTKADRYLFNSEMESMIKKYAEQNDLKLPGAFCRSDWEFYSKIEPDTPFLTIKIVFLARPKTADEILGEQIEFQIKQLQE